MFSFRSLLCLIEPVALSVGFEDVNAMGNAVEKRAVEPFVAEDFGPFFEGQVGRKDQALAFVSAAGHFEEEFGAGLGEGNVAELVEDEQVECLDALEQAFQFTVLTRFK